MILGIDVSHWTGSIDWKAVAGSNVEFAYVKASEGAGGVDQKFAENWRSATEVDLILGAYHFAHPGSDPIRQAEHFAELVGPMVPGMLPPALDLETDDNLAPADVLNWTTHFVLEAERLLGHWLMIYTGNLWRNTLGDPIVEQLRGRPLWTARYGSREPHVPKMWDRWTFWQFTNGRVGDVQKIPGIVPPVDCNWYNGDLTSLQALAGLEAAP